MEIHFHNTQGDKTMRRRVIVVLAVLVAAVVVVTGCDVPEATGQANNPSGQADHPDGVYRGSFMDRGTIQISLEFQLRRNVITEISYNHLAYRGVPCVESPWGPQYEQAIQHLVGKDIRESLDDLYSPGEFVDDVDGFTGATIRANKARSAIQDALNRGAYSL
jgi:uncharacterized protein with FMN-binding domain